MKIPRLLEDFSTSITLFSTVWECEIPLWRHAVSSWVRCSWSHVIFVMKFTTSLWPLKPKGMVHAYECMGKNHLIPVILDEVAHKLGLMLLFRYGLCLSITYLENPRKLLCYFWWRHLQIRVSVTVQVWFMPINKSFFNSDGSVYKLGLVSPFRHGLCYFWWRSLQIKVSVTVREWLIPTNIPSEISCCLRWRSLHIRVSVTVQVWFMPINKSFFASDEGVYKLGLVLPFRYGLFYFWWRRLHIRVSVLFGNGLYLPIYLRKYHVVSDECVYKLGLVLLFRYGFCLSKACLENPRKLLCYFCSGVVYAYQ